MEPHKKSDYLLWGLIILFVVSIATAGYFVYQTLTLQKMLTDITQDRDAQLKLLSEANNTIKDSNDTIASLNEKLGETIEELDETEDDLREEKNRNDDFQDQINSIAGTVGTLDKLSKTDKELLQKYSKVYFLNENYIPSNIKQIDDEYILAGREPQFFHGEAIPFLERLIKRAERGNIDLKVVSAYRSFDTQTELKGQYTQTYGTGANAFSADQGYSEHQLGTTVDLSDPATGGAYTSFQSTEAYTWLLDNAHKYGFTLSYPDDNNFYVFEPWHWRFVGEDLAEYLYEHNLHFYDLTQREIGAYLIKIFD